MNPLEQLRETWRRDQVFDFVQPAPDFSTKVDTTHGPILYVEDVSVSFDGFKALNNLNLYIDDGELRCIIGPNGAGKTTMMDVITGKTRPDTGSVWFGQRMNLLKLSEHEIARGGIGQDPSLPGVDLDVKAVAGAGEPGRHQLRPDVEHPGEAIPLII